MKLKRTWQPTQEVIDWHRDRLTSLREAVWLIGDKVAYHVAPDTKVIRALAVNDMEYHERTKMVLEILGYQVT